MMGADESLSGFNVYTISKIVLMAIYRICWRIRFFGRENIPRQGGLLVVSNHSSFLDPVAIGLGIPRRIAFLAKKELFRFPLKQWMWALGTGSRPINPELGGRQALQSAEKVLAEGRVLVVFPEGTRVQDGSIGPGRPGVGMLALRSKISVLPTYLQGAFQAWPPSRRLPRLGRIRVFYGAPILPEEFEHLPQDRNSYDMITKRAMEAIRSLAGKAADDAAVAALNNACDDKEMVPGPTLGKACNGPTARRD